MNIYLPPNITPLKGHESEATAYILKDYPYGGYRTSRRTWVETKDSKGQRLCNQTLDPKRQIWNKPHCSTYSEVIVLFINKDKGAGYIEHSCLGIYNSKADIDAFVEIFKSVLTEWQKKRIAMVRAGNLKYSIKSYLGMSAEQEVEWDAFKATLPQTGDERVEKMRLWLNERWPGCTKTKID